MNPTPQGEDMTLFARQVTSKPTTVGIREFTRNMPSFHKILAQKPVVVLRNNRPSFVAISPDEYEKLMAACEELHYANLFEATVQARQHNKKIPWHKAKKLLAH